MRMVAASMAVATARSNPRWRRRAAGPKAKGRRLAAPAFA